MAQGSVLDIKGYDPEASQATTSENSMVQAAAEEQNVYKTIPQLEKAVKDTKKSMERAAREMDFIEAARLRDEMFRLQKELEQLKS